jgi:membrane protease YdiL (CAAX protease family)
MQNPIQILKLYSKQAKEYSNLRFIMESSLLAISMQLLVQALRIFLSPSISIDQSRSNLELLDNSNIIIFVINIVFISPFIETLIGQWLPIKIAMFFTRHKLELILLSALFFTSLHLNAGLYVFVGLFPVACIYSWSFLLKKEESIWKAYWITFLIHAVHNLIVLLLHSAAKSLIAYI